MFSAWKNIFAEIAISGSIRPVTQATTTLCEELGLPQPTVSHHLGLLRMRNLITNRRSGKQIFYGLNGHVNPITTDRGLAIQVDRFMISINGTDGI